MPYPIGMKRMVPVLFAVFLALPPLVSGFDPFNMTQQEIDALFRQGQREWEEYQRKKEAEREKAVRKGVVTVPVHAQKYVFQAVARHMKIALLPGDLGPTVIYASYIELYEFQDAIKAEYGTNAGYSAVTNVFLPKQNAIYLADAAKLYQKGRTIDDSLAHEFAHYFQYHYLGAKEDPSPDYDRLESEAIKVQEWFRAGHAAARP